VDARSYYPKTQRNAFNKY